MQGEKGNFFTKKGSLSRGGGKNPQNGQRFPGVGRKKERILPLGWNSRNANSGR